MTESYANVFRFASVAFVVSGVVLLPGRQWRTYSFKSLKPLNKFYLSKKLH